jgi:hypothetical protein
MRTPPFQMFCDKRAKKVAVFIYRATMKRVSPAGIDKISARLMAVRQDKMSDQVMNTRIGEEEEAILKENKYNSLKIWKFSGAAVMRLCTHVALKGWGEVEFDEIPGLQRRFFNAMRWAENDRDVNKKMNALFDEILLEYAN